MKQNIMLREFTSLLSKFMLVKRFPYNCKRFDDDNFGYILVGT